jgi:hypothetical protein
MSQRRSLVRLLLAESLSTLSVMNRDWAHAESANPQERREILIGMETQLASLLVTDLRELRRQLRAELKRSTD